MNSSTREMSLRDVYRAIFRHRRKSLAIFVLVMMVSVGYILLAEPRYASHAKLFVRLGRENAMLDRTATLGEEAVVTVPNSREEELNSVAEMIGSRAMIERVVDQLGVEIVLKPEDLDLSEGGVSGSHATKEAGLLGQAQVWATGVRDAASAQVSRVKNWISPNTEPPRESAIRKLKSNLGVEAGHKSNIIRVSYVGPSPEAARLIVDTVVELYREAHAGLNRTEGSAEFFTQHALRLEGELHAKEDELTKLKSETGLASIDEQRTQLITRIGALEDQLAAAESARAESAAKVDSLKKMMRKLPKTQVAEETTGIGNEGTDGIRQRLFDLQQQEKAAAAVYTDAHPRLREVREQLAEAQRIVEQEDEVRTHITTRPDPNYELARQTLLEEEPVLASLAAKTQAIRSQRDDLVARLDVLNENETRIAQLTRDIELREQDYKKYSASREQALIDDALEARNMSNISVVQPATLETSAISPQRKIALGLAFVVGLAGAFGVAVTAEYFDRTFRTSDDVQRELHIPTLASVPRVHRHVLGKNAVHATADDIEPRQQTTAGNGDH